MASRSGELGYRGLLLLAFVLPFDMEQRPLLWTSYLSITNLTVVLIAVAVVALVSVGELALSALRGSSDAARYFSRRRLPLALLAVYFLSSVVSTIFASSSAQSLTWFLSVLAGALLWLAIPIWLAEHTESRVKCIMTSIVAGAMAASVVGFIEVAVGPAFDQHLLVFKFGPSTMGPFMRLSATFSSANVAAMYFELVLLFAVGGLIAALAGSTSRRWIAFAAWLAAIDVLLVALVLTYSRGALFGLLAAGLAMLLAVRRSHTWVRWRLPSVIVAADLAVVFATLSLSTSSIELLRISTQTDRVWYQAGYVSSVPATMAAGETCAISVTVENRSALTWNGSSPHTYGLSYHWLRPSWKVVRFANNITWLSSDLRPGGKLMVRAKVRAPAAPGSYLFVWDMIWKGTTWFAPRTGQYEASTVRVIPAGRRSAQSPSIGRDPSPDIVDLPTAAALDRGQIWAVATTMIRKRPLFGLGPQGVRMNFAEYAPPSLATQARRPPPHAHNLALEMLADWGLIGGLLFFGLLIALWWPLVQRVVRGQVRSVWEAAVIGAAAALLGHELVDYFLTKQSISIMFWLLCGLAATMARSASAAPTGRAGMYY